MFSILRSLTCVVVSVSLFACAASSEPSTEESERSDETSAPAASVGDQSEPGALQIRKLVYGCPAGHEYCGGWTTCGLLGTSVCCTKWLCGDVVNPTAPTLN